MFVFYQAVKWWLYHTHRGTADIICWSDSLEYWWVKKTNQIQYTLIQAGLYVSSIFFPMLNEILSLCQKQDLSGLSVESSQLLTAIIVLTSSQRVDNKFRWVSVFPTNIHTEIWGCSSTLNQLLLLKWSYISYHQWFTTWV